MLAIVAAALICTANVPSRGVQLVGDDEDPFLDEEVGDQLDEEGGQDQLQVLLQPAKLRLLRLNPDLLLPGDKRGNFKFVLSEKTLSTLTPGSEEKTSTRWMTPPEGKCSSN